MKYYPESKVEIHGFAAKFYDSLLDIISLGSYSIFIKKAIASMEIQPEDKILDFGAGTGRNALLMKKYLGHKGKIIGIDISNLMINQFKRKTKNISNMEIINKRIDKPFELQEKFDKIFIFFVIHGFPNDVRKQIIKNAYNNLEIGGEFVILDFNEFLIQEMPFYSRVIFKTFECKYAFDFVERNWKEILSEFGFGDFKEKLFFKKYVRLLKAKKLRPDLDSKSC